MAVKVTLAGAIGVASGIEVAVALTSVSSGVAATSVGLAAAITVARIAVKVTLAGAIGVASRVARSRSVASCGLASANFRRRPASRQHRLDLPQQSPSRGSRSRSCWPAQSASLLESKSRSRVSTAAAIRRLNVVGRRRRQLRSDSPQQSPSRGSRSRSCWPAQSASLLKSRSRSH